mgnify:CR=1 FL=1
MEHARSSGLLSMLGLAGCAGGGCASLICVPMALLVWIVNPVMTNLDRVPSYLRPLYDALYDMLPATQVASRIANGEIEVAKFLARNGPSGWYSHACRSRALQSLTSTNPKM